MATKAHPEHQPPAADQAEMVDFETALNDPAAYYAGPEAILADAELGREQKMRFLSEWSQDLANRQVADDEGMTAGEPSDEVEAAEAELMKRINAALEQLKDMPHDEPETARSFWKRLISPGV